MSPLFSQHKKALSDLSPPYLHLPTIYTHSSQNTMDSPWPENISGDRKMAIEKLLEGREFTKQLQNLLSGKPITKDGDGIVSDAEDLVMKISSSFTDTISILNSVESDEVSQNPAASSPGWDGRKSEDSGESCRSSTLKDRRGCYKRRRSANSWTRLTATLVDDGYAWRKYGQKPILNATHPRNYFRCTHKHDQGCQATKQVQKTEEDPSMYRITYNGHHTCNNLLKAPQIVFDDSARGTSEPSSIFLNFGSNITEKNDENPSSFLTSFPFIKKESKNHHQEDIKPVSDQNKQPSSSDFLLSPDHLTTFDSSNLGSSEYGDVISEMRSSASLDMEIMVGMVDFDDMQFGF